MRDMLGRKNFLDDRTLLILSIIKYLQVNI